MKVTAAEKLRVASQLRSSIEICFAHWDGLQGFDFGLEFDRWIEAISAIEQRRDFTLITMRFMAGFRNGHTAFNDRWLWQTAGQSTGFALKELREGWTVTKSAVPDLLAGERVGAIDGEPVSSWARRIAPYVSASTEWARSEALFSRFYLLPPKFELELTDGRHVRCERGKWSLEQSRRPVLLDEDVPVLKVPSFALPAYEDEAIQLLARVHDRPALIVDIRGNGGGNTPTQLLASLMDRPYTTWAEETPSQSGLHYAFGDRPPSIQYPSTVFEPVEGAFRGKLAILADPSTGSAAEDFLAPFKGNGRALVVGRTTAGSSGQPYVKDFSNGMVLAVGSKREIFPDGSPFEGVGIAPDLPVELTTADLCNGTDRDRLTAAVALIG